MVKISRIIHQTEWIRSTRIGELKIANVAPSKEHSLRNMISGHNRGRGLEQGVFIQSTYNAEGQRMAIYAMPREEYLLKIKTGEDEKDWKQNLPTGFYDKDRWDDESEHD